MVLFYSDFLFESTPQQTPSSAFVRALCDYFYFTGCFLFLYNGMNVVFL